MQAANKTEWVKGTFSREEWDRMCTNGARVYLIYRKLKELVARGDDKVLERPATWAEGLIAEIQCCGFGKWAKRADPQRVLFTDDEEADLDGEE